MSHKSRILNNMAMKATNLGTCCNFALLPAFLYINDCFSTKRPIKAIRLLAPELATPLFLFKFVLVKITWIWIRA
jgi:hypothetical protein